MKIDRLLGIVIYLLNRDIVNANTLAEKFEVSTRTIQRDIETLNLAGIPITSIQGTNGGYGIVDGFKLEKQITNAEDYLFIITALTGMCSAYNNKKLESTLEKLLSVSKHGKDVSAKIRLDFSVSREGSYIDEYLKLMEKAMDEERIIKFEYMNAYGEKKLRLVEPVVVTYKWYGWYLLAYCSEKKDYRLFKIVRMRNLKIVDKSFSMKHEDADKLLAQQEVSDKRKYIDLKILCKENIRISVEEYFPNGTITELDDGNLILQFSVPENELGWKGILLSYGNNIKILEPDELKEEFVTRAKEIISQYDI